MWKNDRGFTLIEVLIVLSMVFVISSSVLYVSSSYIKKNSFQLFMNQFKLDVYHLQSLSISNSTYSTLVFEENGTSYSTRKSFYEPIVKREMPKGVSLSKRSSLSEISFHPNGSIEKFGTLVFDTPNGVILVRIYIGKGRMTVEE
ncbi:MAG: competence type IV pilus minor pilin ComGD [Paenisporosarcina sp.]